MVDHQLYRHLVRFADVRQDVTTYEVVALEPRLEFREAAVGNGEYCQGPAPKAID